MRLGKVKRLPKISQLLSRKVGAGTQSHVVINFKVCPIIQACGWALWPNREECLVPVLWGRKAVTLRAGLGVKGYVLCFVQRWFSSLANCGVWGSQWQWLAQSQLHLHRPPVLPMSPGQWQGHSWGLFLRLQTPREPRLWLCRRKVMCPDSPVS